MNPGQSWTIPTAGLEHLNRHVQEARLRQHLHSDVAVAAVGAPPLLPRLCPRPPARCPSAAWRGRRWLRHGMIPSPADLAVRDRRADAAMQPACGSGGGTAPTACVHWGPHQSKSSVAPTDSALAAHLMSRFRRIDYIQNSPRSSSDWKREGSQQRLQSRPDDSTVVLSERQAGCAAGNGCVLSGERAKGGRPGLCDVGIAWRLSSSVSGWEVVGLLPAQQVCAVTLCNRGISDKTLAN